MADGPEFPSLNKLEWEIIGFCHHTGLPFEGCIDFGICRCGLDRNEIESYRADVTEEWKIIMEQEPERVAKYLRSVGWNSSYSWQCGCGPNGLCSTHEHMRKEEETHGQLPGDR